MALILDDIGARHRDAAVFELPQAITLAFLPYTPYGHTLAQRAREEQREVMLHLPMRPLGDKAPGPWAIEPQMAQQEVIERVQRALAAIPFTSGVNNHMGSAVTGDAEMMGWVMAELARQGKFFIDSRTTADSQAYAAAQKLGLPSLQRDVFLDPLPDLTILQKQWRLAIKQAKQRGQVVVIAHPYPETLAFLPAALAQLEQEGIRLVPVSALLSDEGWPPPAPSAP
ncbi:divergent polysaccharide deacetylase family protein [Ferrimonas gelatinilytica]|uniref:Divergent polysaccharide deacetylase family protein n=1 Tax=Ferrimonas gelatinilytica TaxID=1255257 RepID=A0ABP9RW62_9GAMM